MPPKVYITPIAVDFPHISSPHFPIAIQIDQWHYTLSPADRLTISNTFPYYTLSSAAKLTISVTFPYYTLSSAARLTISVTFPYYTLSSAARLTISVTFPHYTLSSAARLTISNTFPYYTPKTDNVQVRPTFPGKVFQFVLAQLPQTTPAYFPAPSSKQSMFQSTCIETP